MQQVKAICVLCAAIIPTLVLAAPASVGDNKFVFANPDDEVERTFCHGRVAQFRSPSAIPCINPIK